MILFINNIYRILKEKSNFITMILVPVFFMALILVMNAGGAYTLRVGLADYDETGLTSILQENLKEHNIVIATTEETLQKDLLDMKIDYAIIIPKGFTQEIIEMKSPQLEGIRIQDSNIAMATIYYIENFLNGVNNIALMAKGDSEEFYRGLEVYQNGLFQVENTMIEGADNSEGITLAGLGFMVMSMLFFSTYIANSILEDKENKTFYRIISAPVKLKNYMISSLLSFLFLSQVQIFLLFIIMLNIFKMNFGPSIFNLYFVLLIFSLVSVSFGVALTGLAKDARQASSTATLLITPMVMLGGGFWPREIMPEFLQQIGNFVPVTWVLKAAEKVLYGDNLAAIGIEIAVLLLFSLTFFLLGTWKRTDISL